MSSVRPGHSSRLRLLLAAAALLPGPAAMAEPTIISADPARPQQEFQGMGCGAIFYEGHITSLAARGKADLQRRLYDDMFTNVRTDFLHLMIRRDHEPENDNADPWKPELKDEAFKYCEHTIAICQAARERRPKMELYATLYTPPAWMKTNNDPGGGGPQKATLKPGMELELGEFCWAFLDHLHRHGQTVRWLSIANEPDWPHTQPGYFLTPEAHASLFAKVGAYLEEMGRRFPAVPRPKLVGPNVLSAVGCAENYLPPTLAKAGKYLDVVGCHDYDRRGDRWAVLRKAAQKRPLWLTEWCVNGPDKSPELIHSATEFWLAMTEAFNGGANVWMAYDWVYPPRQGGEALIHLNWGQDYHLTKIYDGFRQWCAPLAPGMKIVPVKLSGPAATGISKPGVKAAAFLAADGNRMVIHVAAVQDAAAEVIIDAGSAFGRRPVLRRRTSGAETMAELPPLPAPGGRLKETLPARSMATFVFER